MENQCIRQQETKINKYEFPQANRWDEAGNKIENKIINNNPIQNKYNTNKIINQINNFNLDEKIKNEGN